MSDNKGKKVSIYLDGESLGILASVADDTNGASSMSKLINKAIKTAYPFYLAKLQFTSFGLIAIKHGLFSLLQNVDMSGGLNNEFQGWHLIGPDKTVLPPELIREANELHAKIDQSKHPEESFTVYCYDSKHEKVEQLDFGTIFAARCHIQEKLNQIDKEIAKNNDRIKVSHSSPDDECFRDHFNILTEKGRMVMIHIEPNNTKDPEETGKSNALKVLPET